VRISKDEIIAGYPALAVRGFLRRYRVFDITAPAVAQELHIDELAAQKFLCAIESLGLIEVAETAPQDSEPTYSITIKGNALANASAAKPIRRSTAELALSQFMTRLDRFNASDEYVYRVKSAVLFGSMLSDAERLGDVDIAIELEPKMADEAAFRKLCDARRKLAMRRGKCFQSTVDWAYWPRMEVFYVLRARSRALSLQEWDQVVRIPRVRYRVLFGDRRRIVEIISEGTCVDD
jgi:predicted nucleotidyltransferase